MFPHLIIHFLDNYHVPLNGPLVFKTTQTDQMRKPKSQVTSYNLPKVVHHSVAELGFQAHLTPELSPSRNLPALPLLAPVTVASQLGCMYSHMCGQQCLCRICAPTPVEAGGGPVNYSPSVLEGRMLCLGSKTPASLCGSAWLQSR